MGTGLNVVTGIVSLLGYAPLAVFIGGLAKVTDVVNNNNWSNWAKQVVYMLEWYLIAAGIVYFLLIALVAFVGKLRRSGTFLIGWLMCSTALLIYSGTKYLIIIQRVDSQGSYTDPGTGEAYASGSLPYLRCVAAGIISTAGWSFFITILVNLAMTTDDVHGGHKGAAPANIA